jgi:D-glycero-alpha-D-manno-heptose-7-phosphate kinase
MVAVVAALSRHWSGDAQQALDPTMSARLAHRGETSTGAQSGVQDQLGAAHGGVLMMEIDYPDAVVRALTVDEATIEALGRRLLTVSFGVPHRSSAVHESVIERLERTDPEPWMRPLREAAHQGAQALETGDLDAYADAIIMNTNAQRGLHPELIGADAVELMRDVARLGAVVKVNGAGGEGGSATVLLPDDDTDRRRAALAVIADHATWRTLPLDVHRSGVTVTQELGDGRFRS